MNPPNPAIVTQSAVSPLPRWALLLLCIAYVVPGFISRDPWKSADVTAFGYMLELANGRTSWLSPLLGGMPPETEGLLPPLPPAQEGGEPQPRTMECLTPKKSLKVWNPK